MLDESFHCHVTESFTCTTALAGTKRRPVKLTAAEAGGAPAAAVKVRVGSEVISGVAVRVCRPPQPKLAGGAATPFPPRGAFSRPPPPPPPRPRHGAGTAGAGAGV